ncbi:beta-galactosidase, partial [Opitutaceae bacterium]|nr:beta-galactosidase [Opitutaceae bacterium]
MPVPLSTRVEMREGRPTLMLNDEPVAPLIYALSDCPGARWSWEEVPTRNIAEFGQRGIRVFQVDLWLHQMLGEDGAIDVTLAQRQIAGVTAAAPNAAVMIRLHLNPPTQWIYDHPDEQVGYADTEAEDPPIHGLHRPLAHDGASPIRASFYSAPWQDWAHLKLRDFCTKLATTPEGDALCGIQLANGVYGEWHQFGFIHHDPDTGIAATKAFRAWLQEKYQTETALTDAWNQPGLTWDTVESPDSPARETASIGILRDPQKQRAVIDYYTFQHTTLTNIVVAFGATTKAAWPRPLITAAFFGYFYSIFGRQAAGAQLAAEHALNSPYLDAWCSPQSYEANARKFGGPGNARGIIGVVRRAGKLWLDEMDMPTSHVGCPWEEDFESTPADDIAIHRRNVM